MPNMEVTIAKNLKVLREHQNISQKELAEEVGIAQSNIANYELGTKVPSLNVIIKLTQVLNCTLEQLIYANNLTYILTQKGG